MLVFDLCLIEFFDLPANRGACQATLSGAFLNPALSFKAGLCERSHKRCISRWRPRIRRLMSERRCSRLRFSAVTSLRVSETALSVLADDDSGRKAAMLVIAG